jgi:4-amino-4-deoxy-L-arabinose transferase-like glycosyltransferase
MKQFLLCLLIGVGTGIAFAAMFVLIISGVLMLCCLHTLSPWLAILIFILSACVIVIGVGLLALFGWLERVLLTEERSNENE